MTTPLSIRAKLLFPLLLVSLIYSCQQREEKKDRIAVDTVVADTVAKKEVVKDDAVIVNRIYNDIGRFIAGLKQDSGSSLAGLEKTKEWTAYAASFEKNWNKLDSGRFARMREFAAREFSEINASRKTVFYPFSGPDFLNVYTFFPSGDEYYMLGLEPSGAVPAIHPRIAADSLNMLFNSLDRSLYAILNYSFFRTISMAEDLRSQQVKGTLPIIMLFLTRTGNTILDVEDVTLSNEGKVILKSLAAANDSTAKRINGSRVWFKNKLDGKRSAVVYFSADIVDQSLRSLPGFGKFTDSMSSVVTYLKSASYLMHKTYFSGIRTAILNKSAYILQDDSGIPHRFLNDSTTWELTYYGNYIRPIPLFANWFQQDLFDAYHDSKNTVKPLDFGIGYNFKSGSHLILARRKK